MCIIIISAQITIMGIKITQSLFKLSEVRHELDNISSRHLLSFINAQT